MAVRSIIALELFQKRMNLALQNLYQKAGDQKTAKLLNQASVKEYQRKKPI